jgi:hypothetical protein
MNSQIFSRDYLQSAPQLEKQRQIDAIISEFIDELIKCASEGKTEYCINLNSNEKGNRSNSLYVGSMMGVNQMIRQMHNKLTDAELIAGLFTRFPGCKIYLDETNLTPTSNQQSFRKGIVIDWS